MACTLCLEEEEAADHEDKEAHNEDHTTQDSTRHQAVDDKKTQSPPASEYAGPLLPLLLLLQTHAQGQDAYLATNSTMQHQVPGQATPVSTTDQ